MTARAERLDKMMMEQESKMDTYIEADEEMLKLIHISDLEIQKLEAIQSFE